MNKANIVPTILIMFLASLVIREKIIFDAKVRKLKRAIFALIVLNCLQIFYWWIYEN